MCFIFFAVFAQKVEVVGNNMVPNINVNDIIFCIRPNYLINDIQLIDLKIIPGIKHLFHYGHGDVIVANDRLEFTDKLIIHPRLIRIIAIENEVVEIASNKVFVNGRKLKNKRYGPYIIEYSKYNKQYLILPNMQAIQEKVIVPSNHVLCMYDNRYNPEQGLYYLLIEHHNIILMPFINITNLLSYLFFYV